MSEPEPISVDDLHQSPDVLDPSVVVEPTEPEPVDEAAERELCHGITRSGQPCRNRALPGELYCRRHLAQAAATAAERAAAVEEAAPEAAREEGAALEDAALQAAAEPGAAPEEGPFQATIEQGATLEEAALLAEVETAPGDALQSETSGEEAVDAEGLRAQLRAEVDRLAEIVEKMAPPGYTPPPFSPTELLRLLENNLRRLSPEMRLGILNSLRESLSGDVFDVDTWRGLWTMLNYTLEYQGDLLKRRFRGEYEVDPYGYDPEFTEWVRPLFQFLYHRYWRVETSGMERVPETGRAMLVANHSGALPWDGAMIEMAIMEEHANPRLVRAAIAEWLETLPFLSVLLQKTGQVLAHPENIARLLDQDELVLVFPEGYKGVGKLFRDRYRLARFGRGGFIRTALRTGAPIIPVAVTGSEEIYPVLYKSDTLARVTGFPYFPISPTFPWLGLLGFIPLPTKWYIDFGEPIATDEYAPDEGDNLSLVGELTDEVRDRVQNMLYERLKTRRSVFRG